MAAVYFLARMKKKKERNEKTVTAVLIYSMLTNQTDNHSIHEYFDERLGIHYNHTVCLCIYLATPLLYFGFARRSAKCCI